MVDLTDGARGQSIAEQIVRAIFLLNAADRLLLCVWVRSILRILNYANMPDKL